MCGTRRLVPAPRMPPASTATSRSAEVVVGSAGSHLRIDAMHVVTAAACAVCSQVTDASHCPIALGINCSQLGGHSLGNEGRVQVIVEVVVSITTDTARRRKPEAATFGWSPGHTGACPLLQVRPAAMAALAASSAAPRPLCLPLSMGSPWGRRQCTQRRHAQRRHARWRGPRRGPCRRGRWQCDRRCAQRCARRQMHTTCGCSCPWGRRCGAHSGGVLD
jgi:hypothetical protein